MVREREAVAPPSVPPPQITTRDLGRWRDLLAQNVVDVDVRIPATGSFSGSMLMSVGAYSRVGELAGRRITCIRDQARAAGQDRGSILLVVQHRGRSMVSQDDREAEIAAGQMVLVDLSRPYLFDIVSDFHQTVVAVRGVSSAAHGVDSRDFTAVPLETSGSLAPAVAFVANVCELATRAGAGAFRPLESLLAEVVRALGDAAARASGREDDPRGELLRQVLDFVRSHCVDPDLDVQRVADTFFMSRRALFRLFETHSSGLAEVIVASRVERAAAILRDQPGRSVENVRAACGFGSAASFRRAFAQAYGCTPTDFRRRS